jgi:hypothetical protein
VYSIALARMKQTTKAQKSNYAKPTHTGMKYSKYKNVNLPKIQL